MGSWVLTIKGVGCHHNDNPEIDANLLAPKLVKQLQDQGHSITEATFQLTGSEESVMPAAPEGSG